MAQDYVGTLNLLLRYARDYNNLSVDDRDSYEIMRNDLIKVLQSATVAQSPRKSFMFPGQPKQRTWLPYAEYKRQKEIEYRRWSKNRDYYD